MDMIAGLSPLELIVSIVIIFLAGIVRGYSGFGFSALVVMSLVLILPPAEVVPIAFILEIGASLAMLPYVWRKVKWNVAGWLFAGAAIGSPVGVHFLATIDPDFMKLMISGIVLMACFLLIRGYRFKAPAGRLGNGATGLLSGLVNGVGAVGGLPVVLLMMAGAAEAVAMRATIVGYLFLSDTYALAISGAQDLVNMVLLQRAGLFALPLALGIYIGSHMFFRTNPEVFRRIILGILIVLACSGIGQVMFL
jgi:uncharacterized membrane protein YfcA